MSAGAKHAPRGGHTGSAGSSGGIHVDAYGSRSGRGYGPGAAAVVVDPDEVWEAKRRHLTNDFKQKVKMVKKLKLGTRR